MHKRTREFIYKSYIKIVLCLIAMAVMVFINIKAMLQKNMGVLFAAALGLIFGIEVIYRLVREIYRIKYLDNVFRAVFPFLPAELVEQPIHDSQELWQGYLERFVRLYKESESLKNSQRTAEIASLSYQINPHFLYNTLESIRSEALMHKDMDAAKMAEALGNFFRYNISRREDVVSVAEELQNIENYIQIQKYRFGRRLDFQVIYHSDRSVLDCAQIPKLALQPLVENAVFHGIEKRISGGRVTLHLSAGADRLWITVEDNGPGMDPADVEHINRQILEHRIIHEANERHGGIALVNVNSRIQMIFGEEYGLTFSAVKNWGTQVEIMLPYKVVGE